MSFSYTSCTRVLSDGIYSYQLVFGLLVHNIYVHLIFVASNLVFDHLKALGSRYGCRSLSQTSVLALMRRLRVADAETAELTKKKKPQKQKTEPKIKKYMDIDIHNKPL